MTMNNLRALQDWLAAWPQLKQTGRQWEGPCPACGGKDRFWVRQDGRFGCRQCRPGKANPDAFQAILQAAFGDDRPAPRPAATPPEGPEQRPGCNPAGKASSAWHAAVSTQDTPAARYLVDRRIWWSTALDACVGWIPASHWPDCGLRLPGEAAGAIAYRLAWPAGDHAAVQLDALTQGGQHTPRRWRRTVGRSAGLAMLVPGKQRWPLVLAEGPVDALAANTWTACRCLALGGAAGAGNERLHRAIACQETPVVVLADGDPAGRQAAVALVDALRGLGSECTWQRLREGLDPAAVLAALYERLNGQAPPLPLAWLHQQDACQEALERRLPMLGAALQTPT